MRRWVLQLVHALQQGLPWAPCPSRPPPPVGPRPLPFQVFQQEEEGDEVGVGQGAEKMHHAVFLGSRV